MKQLKLSCLFILIAGIASGQSDSSYLFTKGNKIEISNYFWSGFGKFMQFPTISYEVKTTDMKSQPF
jgi:hypothetical protein